MSAQASQISSQHHGGFAYLKKISGVTRYARMVLLLVVLAWSINLLLEQVNDPEFLPVNKIRIKGEMKHVTEQMLQQAIGNQLSGGFFNTDVEAIQRSVEALPWVDRAAVRRVWPETLFIQVIEQHPVATWKQGGLINMRGEWFKPGTTQVIDGLPVLSGPEASQALLFEKYNDIKSMLLNVGMSVVSLNMDKRHAIQVKLDNGIKLMLGRQEQLARLQRFVAVYPKVLSERVQEIKSIDLRYSNGMSVGWKNAEDIVQGEN